MRSTGVRFLHEALQPQTHVSPLFDFTLASDLSFNRSVSQTVSEQATLILSLARVKLATCFRTLLQASGIAMLRVLPPCFAANQVVTSCMTFDRVNLRVSHAAIHVSYVTCCRTSLQWAGKTRNTYRVCRNKFFATFHNLICCKTGLNTASSKTRNIATNTSLREHPFLLALRRWGRFRRFARRNEKRPQRRRARRNGCFRRLHQHATNSFCSNVAKKVARFFAHFTVPLWHRAHCTCVPARVKFRLQFYLLVSNFLCFVI